MPHRADHEAEEPVVFDDDPGLQARYEHVEHLLGAIGRSEPPDLALPSQKEFGELFAVGGLIGRSA